MKKKSYSRHLSQKLQLFIVLPKTPSMVSKYFNCNDNLQKPILTLNVPCISESSIEITIKFLFSHFFVVPQKVLWRPLRPSNLFRHHKEKWKLKFNLISSLRPGLGQEVLTCFFLDQTMLCSAKKMTGFYVKHNPGLKWVKHNWLGPI